MSTDELKIEAVWSYPEWSAFFLEKCAIYVQVKNESSMPILIEKVECHFQIEDGVDAFVPSTDLQLKLEPTCISRPIRVEFEADLAFKSYTNNYSLVIQYLSDHAQEFKHDPNKFLVFSCLDVGGRIIFISHKDPEDSDCSRILATFLKKLGFVGYIAEDDHRPGLDLWLEKITEILKDSIGVILLWTSKAEASPDNIFREIELAKTAGKRLIMAREAGVTVPSVFRPAIEYYKLDPICSSANLKKLARSVEDTYRMGKYM